jgi:hypothetical protein
MQIPFAGSKTLYWEEYEEKDETEYGKSLGGASDHSVVPGKDGKLI